MNNTCVGKTIRDLKNSQEYRNIPRGTKFNNKPKSRWNKSELCTSLRIRGCGAICHQTVRELKQSQAYMDLPADIRKRSKTKLAICKAIARPTILVLRLHPDLDPRKALSKSSIPNSMNRYCRFEHEEEKFVVKEVIFNDFDDIRNAISNTQDNTIGCLLIITHANRHEIQVGDNDFLAQSDVDELEIKPKLMRNARVLLLACCTGGTTEEELADDGEPEMRGRRRKGRIWFRNTDVDNFANCLAQSIPGHDVLATHGIQRSKDWSMKKVSNNSVCGCEEDVPLPFEFNVRKQNLHIFVHDR